MPYGTPLIPTNLDLTQNRPEKGHFRSRNPNWDIHGQKKTSFLGNFHLCLKATSAVWFLSIISPNLELPPKCRVLASPNLGPFFSNCLSELISHLRWSFCCFNVTVVAYLRRLWAFCRVHCLISFCSTVQPGEWATKLFGFWPNWHKNT